MMQVEFIDTSHVVWIDTSQLFFRLTRLYKICCPFLVPVDSCLLLRVLLELGLIGM